MEEVHNCSITVKYIDNTPHAGHPPSLNTGGDTGYQRGFSFCGYPFIAGEKTALDRCGLILRTFNSSLSTTRLR